ncbi:MAG: TMEM43 family protein [Candidatus Peregrinibacteria bacterium]|nr:TMEM43 family protein [Candidatus Peregrinibacteria bacterium]MDZ4244375.1 TMEM43 family protein [Candidatus Gracilibacteria bacterium]
MQQNFGMGTPPGGGRVVSERVLGSSNPIARYFRNLMKSVGGVVLGLILFFGSFGVMWFSENFTEHSKVVEAVPMSEASALVEGTVKFEGPINVQDYAIVAPTGGDALYYSYLDERCEMETYNETKVVQRDGQDVEQTIEKERNVWKGEPLEEWATFTVGGIKVNPSAAMNKLQLTELSKEGNFNSGECVVGTYRHKTMGFVPSDATTLLVVGDYLGDSVSSGSTFIVTDLGNDALLAKLQGEESTLFWILKAAAALMFAAGLTLIVSPVLMLLNVLPGLGKALQAVVFFVSLILGIVVVLLATIILKFWWLILLLLLGFGIYAWKKKKDAGPVKK